MPSSSHCRINLTVPQQELKLALFRANFTDGANVSNHGVLVEAALTAGLDGNQAREVLASGRYAGEGRNAELEWTSRGICSVLAIFILRKCLI